MVVVDASVAVSVLLHDGEARHRMSVEQLTAPHLIDAEVLQTMRRLVARKTVDAETPFSQSLVQQQRRGPSAPGQHRQQDSHLIYHEPQHQRPGH